MEEELCFGWRATKSDNVFSAKVAYGEPVNYFENCLKAQNLINR
jgi:hypothetical protein